MEAYFNWMMTPPIDRIPSTKREMAETMGVNVATLYRYEKDTLFQEKVAGAKRELGAAWYGDIMGRLKEVVDRGKPQESIAAARVLLKHLEVPSDANVGITGATDLERLKEAVRVIEENQ